MSTFAIRIRPSVQAELAAAAAAEARGESWTVLHHLERAHVLSQPSTREHVRVHGRMLGFALRQRLARDALGQLGRLLAAALFTGFGLVPQGNTGGTNVSALSRMPIPDDLQRAIDAARAA